MCSTCGCSDDAQVRVSPADQLAGGPGHDHAHPGQHSHEYVHDLAHDHAGHLSTSDNSRTVLLEQDVLAKNDLLAQRNRAWLQGKGILALNLMSSPGSGKTTLLERTLWEFDAAITLSVVEGDQETMLDSDRLRATGCRVVQINTGAGCHLDAVMLGDALRALHPPEGSVVFVENVGNLVCPALFDLGEQTKVVIASAAEGEDKPLKYPYMFRSSDLVLVNKVDLLPHLSFDIDQFTRNARTVNPDVRVLAVSATQDSGLAPWYDWLRQRVSVGLLAAMTESSPGPA